MRCLKSAVSTAVQSTALCSASGAAVSKWKYPRFSASCSSMRHLAATSFVMISGYSAEVHYLDEDADEVLVGEQLQRERKPLGFIFLGGNTCSFEARFSAIAVPSVLATTLADHLNFGNLSSVGIDDTAAGRRAARFLLSRGHRRIAVIGGNRAVSSISDQRYQGFLQGFADEGLSHDEALYQKANYNLGSGYRAMNKLLARDAGFTAVFCMSDIMAVGAMRASAFRRISPYWASTASSWGSTRYRGWPRYPSRSRRLPTRAWPFCWDRSKRLLLRRRAW